jgi:hypothetical protein
MVDDNVYFQPTKVIWVFKNGRREVNSKLFFGQVLDVTICIKTIYPLIKVFWLVDSDEKPIMSFIYEAIDQAKKKKRYKWILVMWKKDIDYLSC